MEKAIAQVVDESDLSLNTLEPVLEAPRLSLEQIQRLSPATLAYLGDAIYELHTRQRFLWPPKRSDLYHQQVVAQVRAEAQAQALQQVTPHLSEDEQSIVRKGRNAATTRHRRSDPGTYQQATGFEALLGYLYLTDASRLKELLVYACIESIAL